MKLSIEEALKAKLPLPWKVTDPTGPKFLVARRRPDDLTKELFEHLEAYGVIRNTIRELFYISSSNFAGVMKRLDIPIGKRGGARRGAGKPAGSVNKQNTDVGSGSALKTTPPAELPKIPVESPFRMHDICKSIGFIPMSEFASGQSVDMDRTIDPAEDADGLNYQDRHNLGIDDGGSETIEETGTQALEFFDSPNGCGDRKITIPDPPANSAKLQITCRDYSLMQLKTILASLPAGTTISGVIHISL